MWKTLKGVNNSVKKYKSWLDGEGDPQGIFKIWPYEQESVLENEKHKRLWDFEMKTDHLILVRQPDLGRVNKKGVPAE